jgi:predicted nucleic acid-binding protein
MSTNIRKFLGQTLYLDTMIPYALLRGIEPEAKALFDRIQNGGFTAYTSALTFDELAYRLILALIRDHYKGSPLEKLRQEEKMMIQQFYPKAAPELRRLRRFPNLVVVEIDANDIDTMNEMMLNYHLKPRDGLHLAAMKKVGCFDLLSNDADFDRVSIVHRYVLK